MLRAKKVFVIGHHGVGNIGDDAMLRYSIDQLIAKTPNIQLTLSAGAMVDKQWLCSRNIIIVPRTRARMLLEIPKHDILIVLGGTWLHSCSKTIRYDLVGASLLALLSYARVFGLTVGLVGLGIGPFDRRLGDDIARWVCKLSNFLSVRDEASYQWTRSKSLKNVAVQRCSDPAYGLNKPQKPRILTRLGISALPYHSGYSDIRGGDRKIIEALDRAIKHWLGLSKFNEVVLLPFNHKPGTDSDFTILEPLLEKNRTSARISIAQYSPDPNVMLGEIAQCGRMIAMRYHSVLMTHLARTPMIVIDYHGKTTSLLNEIGFPERGRIRADEVDAENLMPRVVALYESPDQYLASTSHVVFEEHLHSIWPNAEFWKSATI